MKTQRFDEYHKHGCNFSGKLVVVDYHEDLENDPLWGNYGAEVTYDYLKQAKELVVSKYGEPKRVLLSIPEYVVEIA